MACINGMKWCKNLPEIDGNLMGRVDEKIEMYEEKGQLSNSLKG